ncbi:hypothetical protein BHE74_00050371 [Ensete ventricosum]|nr:hypothetical protein BHE74_00050371 [Ensete ventricosum]
MHPLRFPNSGIRAKATRRRDSRAWPGHLQGGGRLQPSPLAKGRSAAARPPGRGGHLQGQQPLVGMTGCPRHTHKGWPPVASPQGPAARGQVPRGGCPQFACKGAAASGPPATSPATCVGAVTVAQRGAKRGLGHPFEKKIILPLQILKILRTVLMYRISKIPSMILKISRTVLM